MRDCSFELARLEEAAFTFSQSIAALAHIEAMKAENARREAVGEAQAYGEEAFDSVPGDFKIDHDAVTARRIKAST